MTMIALGFALGLSAVAPEAQPLDNPHLLEADRVYQELIYRDRRLFGQLEKPQGLKLVDSRARSARSNSAFNLPAAH